MIRKTNDTLGNFILWLGKRNWGVVISIILIIFLFEIFEEVYKNEPLIDPFHIIEFTLFVLILAFVGIVINFYIKANTAQQHIMELLKYKHQLSLQLLACDDWDQLVKELVKLPNSIAQVQLSKFYDFNPITNEMEEVAGWNSPEAQDFKFRYDGRKCLQEHVVDMNLFSPCCTSDGVVEEDEVPQLEFCLPISSPNNLLGIIQFQIKSGETLSEEQVGIFNSISPEMALAYKAALEQKRLAEMGIIEAALAERHSLSAFLHDNLSQNLSYIMMKLDQITAEEDVITGIQLKSDLKLMKGAAQDSYKIVRGLLENTRPETTPKLLNIIKEYSRKVSSRSEIETSIEEKGDELPLLPEIQRTLFYLFQEALSNVEKHAHAQNVNVLVDWGIDSLHLTITDDGVGFNPHNLDETSHFGLDIMRERINNINGQLDIHSCEASGTEVSICVPIELPEKEGLNA